MRRKEKRVKSRVRKTSISLLTPLSKEVEKWIVKNVDYDDWQVVGGGIALDKRMVNDIMVGLGEAGFNIGDDFKLEGSKKKANLRNIKSKVTKKAVVILMPLSSDAKEWVVDNVVFEEYQMQGGGVAMEKGYAADITVGMVEEGFVLGEDFVVNGSKGKNSSRRVKRVSKKSEEARVAKKYDELVEGFLNMNRDVKNMRGSKMTKEENAHKVTKDEESGLTIENSLVFNHIGRKGWAIPIKAQFNMYKEKLAEKYGDVSDAILGDCAERGYAEYEKDGSIMKQSLMILDEIKRRVGVKEETKIKADIVEKANELYENATDEQKISFHNSIADTIKEA